MVPVEQSVEQSVLQIIADSANRLVDSLTRDTKLVDIEISSLDVIEIVFHLEETFNIEIFQGQEAGEQEFASIDDVIVRVEKLLAEGD